MWDKFCFYLSFLRLGFVLELGLKIHLILSLAFLISIRIQSLPFLFPSFQLTFFHTLALNRFVFILNNNSLFVVFIELNQRFPRGRKEMIKIS